MLSAHAGQNTYNSPTTAVSQQLSGLQLLLQQHRQQSPQQQAQPQAQQTPQQQQTAPARVVYIMRGLPGSGKSTRAAQIAAEARAAAGASSSSSVQPVAIHSTDNYFIDPVSGVYVFNVEMLSVNHQKNLDAFCASLAADVGTVIVDNTNIQVGCASSSSHCSTAAAAAAMASSAQTASPAMPACAAGWHTAGYALVPGRLAPRISSTGAGGAAGLAQLLICLYLCSCISAADTDSHHVLTALFPLYVGFLLLPAAVAV